MSYSTSGWRPRTSRGVAVGSPPGTSHISLEVRDDVPITIHARLRVAPTPSEKRSSGSVCTSSSSATGVPNRWRQISNGRICSSGRA